MAGKHFLLFFGHISWRLDASRAVFSLSQRDLVPGGWIARARTPPPAYLAVRLGKRERREDSNGSRALLCTPTVSAVLTEPGSLPAISDPPMKGKAKQALSEERHPFPDSPWHLAVDSGPIRSKVVAVELLPRLLCGQAVLWVGVAFLPHPGLSSHQTDILLAPRLAPPTPETRLPSVSDLEGPGRPPICWNRNICTVPIQGCLTTDFPPTPNIVEIHA